MNSILKDPQPALLNQVVVAAYLGHIDAEAAVRTLAAGGIPMDAISIVGRNFETHDDIQGFYRPADSALSGATEGAWLGGMFGMVLGALGFFILPGLGAFMVLGPLAGMIAGGIGGAGVGAVVNGFIAVGITKEQAVKYQALIEAGEFLILVHGGHDVMLRAHGILENTNQTHIRIHGNDV